MSIERLCEILSPPAAPVENTGIDWPDVERRLGTALPRDYKEFVERFGTRTIGDYIVIFNPISDFRVYNLFVWLNDQITYRRNVQHDDELRELPPFPVYPAAGGVLNFGATDNQDYLYWITTGDPDNWKIVVTDRLTAYGVYDCSLTDFLSGVLSRDLVCRELDDEFPSEQPAFEPTKPWPGAEMRPDR